MILKDKVSIITGASGGIGREIARAFAREGSHLVLASRTGANLEAIRQEIKKLSSSGIEVFQADVSKPQEVTGLVGFALAKFATIDVLVNCAGVQGPIGMVTDIDSEKWLETIRINLYGTFLCIKAVLPTMIKNKKEVFHVTDLKIDDQIVIIGSPNDQGTVEARFIRIFR